MKKIIIQNLKVAFFFFAVQFIVGLLFLFRNFNYETVIWAAKISGTTTLVFTIIVGLYQAVYIKTHKISLKDFDIRPTQSVTFSTDKTIEETVQIIENIIPDKINSYKFKYDKEESFYKAKTGATIRSWGEIIIIKLTQLEDHKTQLSVLSKSLLKTTLIDYGKSSMNIQKIKLAFDQNGL
jgi:hypothetical protein